MVKKQKQLFFDKQVHMVEWKNSMSGENEDEMIEMLETLGYKLEKDFVRQHPIGASIVVDFAFIDEKVAIEIDGKDHNDKKRSEIDEKRDKFLYQNGWFPIRIKDRKLRENPSYYKYLIQYLIDDRRVEFEKGDLYERDIEEFEPVNY